MITSGQLFEKVSCSVIPNNWKLKDVLLTLRDIVNYYMGKVLLTPNEQKRTPHPSDKRFFYVHSFSMVGREANKRAGNTANMPADFCRLEAPDRLHIVVDQLPSKEQK